MQAEDQGSSQAGIPEGVPARVPEAPTSRSKSAEDPRRFLGYDAASGTLVWTGRRKQGLRAGLLNDEGYLRFRLRGLYYLCHRVVWLFETGEWPNGQVDHINRNKADNRFVNLRVCSTSENKQNLGAKSFGKSGLLGVKYRKDRDRWVAVIGLNGKRRYIGSFNNPEQAHDAYVAAKRLLHPFGTL